MNMNKMISFAVALLILAIVFPIGLSTLVTTNINREYSDTDTAVQNASTVEVITVSTTPYITDTVAVTVNATPTTNFTETSSTAGTVTLDAAESTTGDTIVTTYDAAATGIIVTMWDQLPIFVGVGLLLTIMGWVGLRKFGRR